MDVCVHGFGLQDKAICDWERGHDKPQVPLDHVPLNHVIPLNNVHS